MNSPSTMSEWEAINDTTTRLKQFKTKHGGKALKDAVTNGAFNVHPDFGDVVYIFKDREYDHEMIDIPMWALDMFSSIGEEIYN